uniref:Adhesion G protein-coupled receptor B2 n=1 Tax=Sinocyclocheilus grahami TaxID=75366 RepID=A0A672KP47_SINGR
AVPCSSLVAGVLYGSFSLRDLFPRPSALTSGCSWTVENPDPTKYSLYFRFNRHAGACLAFSPLVLPLDHYLSNQTCGPPDQPTFPSDPEAVELCMVPGPHTFLQFDKNYVQLCLTTHPNKDGDNGDGTSEGQAPLSAETLDFRLVEVLLINNENSSHFTCGVLCRWFEECLHISSGWETESCSITQTGCVCPNTAPPVSLLPTNGIAIAPRDENKLFQAQRAAGSDPAAEEWSQWSVCSLTCGQGWQVRSRSCVSSPYGTLCSGPLRETRLCNNTATCPGEPQHQAGRVPPCFWMPIYTFTLSHTLHEQSHSYLFYLIFFLDADWSVQHSRGATIQIIQQGLFTVCITQLVCVRSRQAACQCVC